MAPDDVARTLKLRLAAELEDDLGALGRLAAAIASLEPPAGDARGEWMRCLALAFEIERYYTAVEALLGRTLRTLDGDVPTGHAWHLNLLKAASVAVDGGRVRLVGPETALELRELLKFRHLARHGYEAEPELGRMVEHAARVRRAHAGFDASMRALLTWLRRA